MVLLLLLPFACEGFEFGGHLCDLIPEVGCQLIVLGLRSFELLLALVGDFLLFLLEFLGRSHAREMFAASCLVKRIDGFVREGAIGDVAVGEVDTALQGLVGIDDVVMVLIALLDVMENLKGLFRCGGLKHNLLETAIESTVLFNGFLELPCGCRTDALNLASGKCRLHDVGGIQGARS